MFMLRRYSQCDMDLTGLPHYVNPLTNIALVLYSKSTGFTWLGI